MSIEAGKVVCPKCGSKNIDVLRTWQLVSPFPDKYGRITVTVMGVMKCKDCGHQWRGVVSKIKVGGEEKPREEEKVERRVKEIVLDLEDIEEEE
ncbi:MAG: chromatin protein Cren7 [Thermoprotei archaeon]